MNHLKKIIKGCLSCGAIEFIKYNYLSPNIIRADGCYIFPLKGTIVQISPKACIELNGDLYINAGKYKKSKAESYLVLDEEAKLFVGGYTRLNYNATVHINPKATLHIGSLTSNVGINIQVCQSVHIGFDCMMGRNTAIFDSAFHPTGVSIESMQINTGEVDIGDHVWLGAYSFVGEGTRIGTGSMIGSNVVASGEIPEATTVVHNSDAPSMVGYMWSRTERQADLETAAQFYSSQLIDYSIDSSAVRLYSDGIVRSLKVYYPLIDFANDDHLVSGHVVDSLALISIVKILENEYDISIPFFEISVGNFDSVSRIAGLIHRLKTNSNNASNNTRQVTYPSHDDQYDIVECITLVDYLDAHACKNPNKIAVMTSSSYYTYRQLNDCVKKYAAFLRNQGVGESDRVVVKATQTIEYIIAYLSAHRAGAINVPVEKTASNDRLVEMAKKVGAKIILNSNRDVFDCCKSISLSDVFFDIENTPEDCSYSPLKDKTADILFTTGTTGVAKGVELSHGALIAGADNIVAGCKIRRDTVLVVPNPLSHSNALKNLAACLITGCTFYVLDGMTDIKAYFDALDCQYGKVATVLPPAAIRTLVQLSKEKIAEYDGKIDYLMAAMAPLLEPDRAVLRELLPHVHLYNHYGCSESSSICIYDFNEFSELDNCVGKAMPHSQVFFVNDNREVIKSSPENLGLLAVKGEATMKGYFNEPDLTASIKTGDVIYTNDLGYMDENGFVFILGRSDDVINVGGLKVSPLEVESVVNKYQGVVDSICIGVEDSITGQSLVLLVVPGDDFVLSKLQSLLADNLEPYMVPKKIKLVDKIERTFNGKLNRKYYRNDKGNRR